MTNTDTTRNDNDLRGQNGSDVYQIVTDRVISLLEAGTVPWRKPWASDDRWPMNLVSRKPYHGINVFLLHAAGFGSPYWLTLKQANKRGGRIRANEKSSIAVFWTLYETTDKKTGEKETVPLIRSYRVFNVEQCEGINYPKPKPRTGEFNPIEAAERIVAE